MTSVFLANLSPTTTKESLDKFMAFCGSIQSIEMQEIGKAIVVFEKPSAASTALMLNGGTLDGSPIHVSSEDISDDHPALHHDSHDHEDIPQEAKPRTAIVAEILAQGYVLGDNVVSKAVDYDQKHGISARFLEYFRQILATVKSKTAEVDAQTGASTKAAGAYAQADEKVHLSEKAKNVWQVGKGYYSKVLSSEFGQQAQSFYTSTSNNIKSVHEEASRIAADKKGASTAASEIPPLASGSSTSTTGTAGVPSDIDPAASLGTTEKSTAANTSAPRLV